MKKISQISWKRYLESAEGQAAIAQFSNLNENTTADAAIEIMKQYSPQFFLNLGKKDIKRLMAIYELISNDISEHIAEGITIQSQENFDDYYRYLIANCGGATNLEELNELPESNFKLILSDNMLLTMALHTRLSKYCIPNLFPMQFFYLKKIAEKYELDIPESPKRGQYWDRCMYYLELNKVLLTFGRENNISSTAELCAFLYDYELPLIKESVAQASRLSELPTAAQVWMIEGNYGDGEKDMNYGFWQANAETKRGDILIFYEKAPVMAINSIWRSEEDGCADPFFMYYSYTFIGHKMAVPAITFKEMKEHPYFKDHALVRKNFQGGSGWALNAEDYHQLLTIWTEKGMNCTILPQLKAHEAPSNIDYTEKEAAVHKYLVLPLLKSMGWTEENGDMINQVVQHVGHGESRTNGRTDISLHPYGENLKKAKVLIEEKYWLKNEQEKKDAFDQGLSYALLSESKILVVCDKAQIIVYPKKKDTFRMEDSIVFYWDQMSNPDMFNQLRKILDI